MAGDLAGLIGLGLFSSFFIIVMFLSLVELLGKVYGTYHCLVRKDLTNEQILIYLLAIWFIPLGWVIYLLLGKKRTSELFSDVHFL